MRWLLTAEAAATGNESVMIWRRIVAKIRSRSVLRIFVVMGE
ncbi:hypothetical protein Hanom_Chr14g01306781 [Helianthus anomalus]